MATKKPIPIYQLKIALLDIKPTIFRILQIKGNASLGKLHHYIQGVMGWQDYHLHKFIVNGQSYLSSEQMYEDIEDDPDTHDEKTYRLNKLEQGNKFIYVYDFGDCWEHEITVEKIFSPEDGVYYPVCTYGERACPPEDCGGSIGYEDLLEVLNDPTHEEYEHYSEWAGDFDPKRFNLDEVNDRLSRIKSNLREPK